MDDNLDSGEMPTRQDSNAKDWALAFTAGFGMLALGAWGLKENNAEIMKSFISQAPGVLGVLILSRFFLSHMNRREREYANTTAKQAENCHGVQERATESLDKNTMMLGRAIQTIEQMEDKLDKAGKRRQRPIKEVDKETTTGP